MPDNNFIPGNFRVGGSLGFGSLLNPIQRTWLQQDSLAEYVIPWSAWRVWNAYETTLPGTSASDDLGLYGGTWASASPSIQSRDVNIESTSLFARAMLWLPPEYQAGETVTLRFHAGMLTTVSDTTATLDAVAYRSNSEAGIGSDLVTTAAQSINSLTLANKDFQVDPATLSPGDVLDLRIEFAVVDAATATVVKAIIGKASLLCDIKG